MYRAANFRQSPAVFGFCQCRGQSAIANLAKFTGEIPTEKIEKRYTRSSGPGGQHVQKSLTKCEIRFKLAHASWIPEHLKNAVAERFTNRINAEGEVVIESDRTRERSLNLADCFDKLRSTIYDAERNLNKREETEEDRRLLIKRQEVAAQKRLEEKKRLSKIHQNRAEHFSL